MHKPTPIDSISMDKKNTLVDRYGRHINYLRLSITDRCNLRCVYCMTEHMHFAKQSQVLSFSEIISIVSAFVLLGVRKVRITGGEPLVRHDIASLVQKLSRLSGLEHIALSTNGVTLEQHALSLFQAGVHSVNISLDTLDEDKFKRMTRLGNLNQVLAGIDAAIGIGFQRIKLNCVMLSGYNDEELLSLVEFARRKGVDISFIEEMPLGNITEHRRDKTYYSSQEARATIARYYPLKPSSVTSDLTIGGPSRYYTMDDSNTRVGFISPHSDNFCSSCNRVRLTAEGRLLLCLGNEQSVDLRAVVRAKDFNVASPQPLLDAISNSMSIKPLEHQFDYRQQETQVLRLMNVTGG